MVAYRIPQDNSLNLATGDNNGALVILDSTAGGSGSLKSLNNIHGLLISDLAENDVAAVEPRGDDSGNNKLRAVPDGVVTSFAILSGSCCRATYV